MKKTILILMLSLALVLSFAACGSDSPESAEPEEETTESVEPEETEEVVEAVEGFDFFQNNLWEVGGLRDQYNRVIDINDEPNLKSMYDGTFLCFDADGTFLYLNKFPSEGNYIPFDSDSGESYLLKSEKSYKWDAENDKFVENESSSQKTYIVSVIDNNTFEYAEFDGITGKAKANETTLIFVRSEKESPYIQENKITINPRPNNSSGDSSSGDSSTPPKNASFEAIYDEYVAKMEDAVPGLVNEYYSEASGIHDVERLAEICNSKIEKLAEISNEGMEKMAELMIYKGYSQSTYESWANKLMDKYIDIGMAIQDAYLDSAVG